MRVQYFTLIHFSVSFFLMRLNHLTNKFNCEEAYMNKNSAIVMSNKHFRTVLHNIYCHNMYRNKLVSKIKKITKGNLDNGNAMIQPI